MQDDRLNPELNPEEEVQAVWSIRQTSIPAYFILSGLLFILFNGLHIWRGFANAPTGTAAADIILAGLHDASGMVPWIVLATILLVEGRFMLVERYLKARYFQGRAEGRSEGKAEGLAEGRSEGLAEGRSEGAAEGRSEGAADERRKWRGWLERRATAEREGRPFDEPPPDSPPGPGWQ